MSVQPSELPGEAEMKMPSYREMSEALSKRSISKSPADYGKAGGVPICAPGEVPGIIWPKTETQPWASAAAGSWLDSLTSAERKECAVSRGFMAYFPDAIALVARHSVRMNEKHNPGQPVHWSRGKSNDHDDCIGRHSLAIAVDPDSLDDGQPHMVCRAWRAMAALQEWAEKQGGK
jgi:hypothetical protein